MKAYCVKCKKKNVSMKMPKVHRTKRGGYMAKGKCPKCGTTMCAMISKETAKIMKK